MARDIRTGTVSKPKPPKPAHIGASDVGAAVAVVAPKPPLAKPERPLQKIGFQGGIQDFNNRLQQAHDAHVAARGFEPPPGLALDIARSPIPTDQLSKLFSFGSSVVAKAAASVVNRPGQLVPRHDGVLEPQFPIRPDNRAGPLGAAPPNVGPITLEALHKKYPNVQMGMLPVKDQGMLYQALGFLDSHGGLQKELTQEGLTLPEFEKQVARGHGVAPDMAATAELTAKLAKERGADASGVGAAPLTGAALTLKQAQHELNRQMGTKLPETGYFTGQWVDSLSNWMKSSDYFRKVTSQQAKDAGFGDNIAGYLKAWKSKQAAVQKHGLTTHFLNAMPLQFFGHGVVGGVKSGLIHTVADGSDPWTVGLHTLQHTAGLALDVMGGTVQQAKADLAAGQSFSHAATERAFGKNVTFEKAKKDAADALRANPTWLHALVPELDLTHGPEALRIFDQASNLIGDLILLRKPAFTGERLAAGDIAGAGKSAYVAASSHWAYQYLKAGRINNAAAMLEGGQGANKLASVAAKLVKSGRMTEEQFRTHTAELFANGRTTVNVGGKDFTLDGPLLHSLRTEKLPTPGVPGRTWITSKNHFNDFLDSIDSTFRGTNYKTGDLAASALGSVRSAVSHAAPKGARGMFDETLPSAVKQFVRKNKLGDEALGEKFASDVVRFQAKENVVGLQSVQRKLESLYHGKYPVTDSGAPSEFEATLGTEAPSIFRFPGGGSREVDGALTALESFRRSTTKMFNRLAVVRSRMVLASGFSLFYKHAIADLGRLVIGGGTPGFNVGAAKREIEALAQSSPEFERKLGTFLSRSTQGEARWLLGRSELLPTKSFKTGEFFGKGNYMTAAGAYMRRLLTDDALEAYQYSNHGTDLKPLTDLILNNKTYRGMWKAARRERGVVNPGAPHEFLSAEDYAAEIAARFRDVEDASAASGVTDPFNNAINVLRQNRGAHADEALGKWIGNNKLDMTVPGARVEQIGTFDSVTGRIISTIMTPNKFYRKSFAKNVLNRTYGELRNAGFTEQEAFHAGAALAEKMVKYHMLDFVNRLQVEQDLRWLSWFATKHRLYWKWVLGTLVRRPGVALVVNDVQQHLDRNGNIGFEAFGHRLAIPAARLVWVPGKEYNESSPDAQAVWGIIKSGGDLSAGFQAVSGTYGNVITRVDTPIRLGIKLARMHAGNLPATYGAATQGMDEQTKSRLNRSLNEYQVNYFAEHGHYAPESDAVKHVVMSTMAEEFWRSTLPFPVVPDYQPTSDQQLVHKFMLMVDPRKRRKFLEAHPGFSDHFGVYDQPRIYLHNREFFGRYVTALDALRSARRDVFKKAQQTGFTPELLAAKRSADAAFQKAFDGLLREDAAFAGHKIAASQVPGVDGAPYGPWGKLAAADPQIDPKHLLNALFPKLKQSEYAKVYGALQKQLRQELSLLNNPQYASTYDDQNELKTRRNEIIGQLEVFKNLPSDALGATYAKYQSEHVNPYWKHLEKRLTEIQNLPSADRDEAYAALRTWRDGQDKPLVVDGIKFPSPIRMAWAGLDPKTRHDRLAYFASKSWEHLTNYEKELLGKPVSPGISDAYSIIEKAKADYLAQNYTSGSKEQILGLVKQMDRDPKYKGILQDYLFSRKPLYQRLEVLPLVTHSSHQAQWHTLFSDAAIAAKGIASGNYNSTQIRVEWRKYVKGPEVQHLLDSTPGFRREVESFGPDFLNTLIG